MSASRPTDAVSRLNNITNRWSLAACFAFLTVSGVALTQQESRIRTASEEITMQQGPHSVCGHPATICAQDVGKINPDYLWPHAQKPTINAHQLRELLAYLKHVFGG
jgi:hypothetical protein